jgi:hypothetical protein
MSLIMLFSPIPNSLQKHSGDSLLNFKGDDETASYFVCNALSVHCWGALLPSGETETPKGLYNFSSILLQVGWTQLLVYNLLYFDLLNFDSGYKVTRYVRFRWVSRDKNLAQFIEFSACILPLEVQGEADWSLDFRMASTPNVPPWVRSTK